MEETTVRLDATRSTSGWEQFFHSLIFLYRNAQTTFRIVSIIIILRYFYVWDSLGRVNRSAEEMTGKNQGADTLGFQAILQEDVPKGRDGKHKAIVGKLLSEIERLKPGTALKIPLSALPDSKENIRSALNRASRQRGIEVSTSSDSQHLYIWKAELNS
ncbi:MAG: hypothetical protein ACLGSH_19770 [Acidobacteriota bacterium]